MIIGHVNQKPLGGLPATTPVKNLQLVMNKISDLTKKNFRPGNTKGEMDKGTVIGLIFMASKVGRATPGIDKVWEVINKGLNKIPLLGKVVSAAVTDRNAMSLAWEGLKISGVDMKPVLEWFRDQAGELERSLALTAQALGLSSTGVFLPGARDFPTAVTEAAPTAPRIAYPPGSVAVRDPLAGMYRILAPGPKATT